MPNRSTFSPAPAAVSPAAVAIAAVTAVLAGALALLAVPSGVSAQSTARSLSSLSAPRLSAFAASLTFAGGELFVGRPGDFAFFPMPASRPGGVHVFGLEGGMWSETAAVSPPDDAMGSGYGASVDSRGDVMVVGAPAEGTGAVYVYRRRGRAWSGPQRLVWPDADADARFGAAVATNGEDIVVGAPGAQGGGRVAFFAADGSEWQLLEVRGVESAGGNALGTAVDIEGSLVAVGAPGSDPTVLPGSAPDMRPGAVGVFRKEGANWTQAGVLEPQQGGPTAMGRSVVVSEGTIFAGAPLAGGVGVVYHFAPDGEGWSLRHTIQSETPGAGSGFGMAIAVDEDDLIVGTPFANGLTGGGAAFRRSDGEWEQVAAFGPGGAFAAYGLSVAVEGDFAVAGAPGADFFEGTGFVFRRTDEGWEPAGTVIDNAEGAVPLTGEERLCEDGSAGGFDCSEVDLVSYVPVHALGGDRGVIANDLWGWTDPESGREYAIVGRSNGTAFVDISNPGNPVYLGELPLTEGAIPNMWRDVKVFANHAYVVADNAGPHGVQVFDLTRLRDHQGPPATFDEDARYDGIASAHNIVINEGTGFAYVVGASGGGDTCGGGLHMIDIREPKNPTFAGCFSHSETGNMGTGYSHDAQCVRYHGPDPAYQDREICFGANENALSIADVTDKDSTVVLSSAEYPNTAYLHQGWVTDDHRYFYMNDELDELSGLASQTRTLIWDISDLDEPVLVKEHFGTTGASDHNLYIRGDYMYQANYVSGLRILDISDPENPEEVGFFDTVPAGADVPGFAGAWSVYPFFESGLLIVSSIREGLFVLRKRPPPVS